MTNLSKIKRETLITNLEELKAKNLDNEELIRTINLIQNELNAKKYGLVWEEHEEEIDKKEITDYPVFSEDKKREIYTLEEEPCNFILEGDNLYSLKLLKKTHKGRIDVIYIDPPYNTNNSLTYNDTRVDKLDDYKHSKWLSFMKRRLEICPSLLKETGLFMVSIDDNEGYQLKLLLDDIFGEDNCMGVFAVIKAEGGGMAKYIVKGHDLLFVYAKNIEKAKPLAREKDIRGKKTTINGVEYWIQEDAIRENFGKYGNLHYEDILIKKGQNFKDEIDKGIENNEYILVPKEYGKTVIGKLRRIDEDYSKFYSVIKHLNADGIEELKTMGLDKRFDYPKPLSLIKELIKGATFFNNNAIVLDFFAGSGTTGQAVLELNSEDHKDRTFILCTNNEVSAKSKLEFAQSFGYLPNYEPKVNTTDSAIEKKIYAEFEQGEKDFNKLVKNNEELFLSYGICRNVTYPRIKNVINGYSYKTGKAIKLYEKKLTLANYIYGSQYKEDIEKIKSRNEYSEYKESIKADGKLVLEGISKEHDLYPPKPANLLYYKLKYIKKELMTMIMLLKMSY